MSDAGLATGDDAAAQIADADEVSSVTRSVDSLGRLVTGAGLCAIEGGQSSFRGNHVKLYLEYDERGRPREASATFTENCGQDAPPDDLSIVNAHCFQDVETQTMAWAWDHDDNLLAVQHTVSLQPGGDAWAFTDVAEPRGVESLGPRHCLVDSLFVAEREAWEYDASKRVVAWSGMSADCDGAEGARETLRYRDDRIEVVNEDSDRVRVREYEMDRLGQVLAAEPWRYRYDERGRLIEAVHTNGTLRSWSYDSSLVAENGRRWVQEVSADRRAIKLEDQSSPARTVTILFDAKGRPREIHNAREDWYLTYDGCPNSDRASARWLVHQIFAMWPLPDVPQAGEGLEQRAASTSGALPLRPF